VVEAVKGGSRPRWSREEDQQLAAEIQSGLSWAEIAGLHGRSIGAVRAEAKLIRAVIQSQQQD
jgi:hypothetical protein